MDLKGAWLQIVKTLNDKCFQNVPFKVHNSCRSLQHGLKSGKMLKEMRGHSSYVNDAGYSADGARVISASSDGTVRVWDAKSAEEVSTFKQGGSLSTTNHNHAALTRLFYRSRPMKSRVFPSVKPRVERENVLRV